LVLDKMRNSASFLVDGVASHLPNVSPNSITLFSFLLSIFFGITFYLGYLIPSFFLLLGASYLDALDGSVARMFGKQSKKGDFLDHLTDRYSDLVILTALALSPVGNPYLGMLGIAGTLMTSYVGTQAQAVGIGRIYGGFPGRADRLVIIMVGIILQIFTLKMKFLGFSAISWVLLIIGAAGLLNSLYRAVIAYRSVS